MRHPQYHIKGIPFQKSLREKGAEKILKSSLIPQTSALGELLEATGLKNITNLLSIVIE